MKFLLTLLSVLLVGSSAFAATSSVAINDARSIAGILSTYQLFSNNILAQGMAFGFSPKVEAINVEFVELTSDPEVVECELNLTAKLSAVENGKVVPVPFGTGIPTASYIEEGRCQDIKNDSYSN